MRNVIIFKNIKLQQLTCITLNTWKFGEKKFVNSELAKSAEVFVLVKT